MKLQPPEWIQEEAERTGKDLCHAWRVGRKRRDDSLDARAPEEIRNDDDLAYAFFIGWMKQ